MPENLKRLAHGIDTKPLLEAIERQPDLWKEITDRQDTPGSPHRDTECIFLRWCETKSIEAAFTEIPAIDYPAYEKLPQARLLVETVLQVTGATKLGRVLIAKLNPAGSIEKHADEGAYADCYERFHVALESEPGNTFFVEDREHYGEFAEMQAGELWYFNHKKPHHVFNGSALPRIHLIVDAVAPKFRKERT